MALPRKLTKALKAGTYKPSAASKKAREVAKKIQEERAEEEQRIEEAEPPQPPPPPPGGGPGIDRDIFRSKARMKDRKIVAFYGRRGFNRRSSDRAVDGSEEIDAIEESLDLTTEEMADLASLAGRAHAALTKTGDAGDLEVYLQYDFLFYHLQHQARNRIAQSRQSAQVPRKKL